MTTYTRRPATKQGFNPIKFVTVAIIIAGLIQIASPIIARIG